MSPSKQHVPITLKTACTDNSTFFFKVYPSWGIGTLEIITCTFGESAKICTTKTDFLVPLCKGSQVVLVKRYFILHSMK